MSLTGLSSGWSPGIQDQTILFYVADNSRLRGFFNNYIFICPYSRPGNSGVWQPIYPATNPSFWDAQGNSEVPRPSKVIGLTYGDQATQIWFISTVGELWMMFIAAGADPTNIGNWTKPQQWTYKEDYRVLDAAVTMLTDGNLSLTARPQFFLSTADDRGLGMHTVWKMNGIESGGSWSPIYPYTPPSDQISTLCGTPPSAAAAHIFAIESKVGGRIFTSWKIDPANEDSAWTEWSIAPSPPFPVEQMMCVVLTDGRLQQIANVKPFGGPVPDTNLYTRWKLTTEHGSNWSEWVPFQFLIGGAPVVLPFDNNRGLMTWTPWPSTTAFQSVGDDLENLVEWHKTNPVDSNAGWSQLDSDLDQPF